VGSNPTPSAQVSRQRGHDPEHRFWAHHPTLFEQRRRPFHDGELRLELGDAPAGCPQLRVVGRRGSDELTAVDPLLAHPAVDGGLTDVHGGGDLRHLSAGGTWSTTIARNCGSYEWGTAFLLEVGRQSHNHGPTGGGPIRWTTIRGPPHSSLLSSPIQCSLQAIDRVEARTVV
jgi:hypothetical protein